MANAYKKAYKKMTGGQEDKATGSKTIDVRRFPAESDFLIFQNSLGVP